MKQNTQKLKIAESDEEAIELNHKLWTGSDAHNQQSLETARVETNRPSQPTVTGVELPKFSWQEWQSALTPSEEHQIALSTGLFSDETGYDLSKVHVFDKAINAARSKKLGLAVNAQQTDTLSPSTKNKP